MTDAQKLREAIETKSWKRTITQQMLIDDAARLVLSVQVAEGEVEAMCRAVYQDWDNAPSTPDRERMEKALAASALYRQREGSAKTETPWTLAIMTDGSVSCVHPILSTVILKFDGGVKVSRNLKEARQMLSGGRGSGHTPGPWTVAAPHMGFSEIRGPVGELVFGLAAGSDDEKRSDDVCNANARLIAAAPDMLDALDHVEAVLSIVEPRSDKAEYLNCLEQVRAAIAKAQGTRAETSPSAQPDRASSITQKATP
jgi:hypothetical protein